MSHVGVVTFGAGWEGDVLYVFVVLQNSQITRLLISTKTNCLANTGNMHPTRGAVRCPTCAIQGPPDRTKQRPLEVICIWKAFMLAYMLWKGMCGWLVMCLKCATGLALNPLNSASWYYCKIREFGKNWISQQTPLVVVWCKWFKILRRVCLHSKI